VYIASSNLDAGLLHDVDSSVATEMRSMMAKIGVMMSPDRADEKMSSHFGKAEWIMVADSDNLTPVFVKNEGLNGKGTVEIMIRLGCTDVILADIGDGALGQLQSANIRAWAVPESIAGSKALRMFRDGQLTSVPPARASARHGVSHGCNCTSTSEAEIGGCCRS
jgi:predicted Fe-Mo cluster-binding NifX family protein